ncbi:MAG: hypothetical protein WBK96_06910 [Candidatus Manganitrophaceae bacterium]
MSSDKNSIIEKAKKFTAKGQIDKAIEEWQKLIAETPNDGNIYNTIGDLHLKVSRTGEAIEAYLKGAEAFKGAGFELKGIAVYKKILKLDPARIDVYEKLADLHAERGLIANAVEDYLRVAKHHAKQGDLQVSVSVYRKLANLDPKNFAVRQKLAEICQKWGLEKEAVEEYGKVLEIFKDRQMDSEAQQVIDEVKKIDPSFAGENPPPEEIESRSGSSPEVQSIPAETSPAPAAAAQPDALTELLAEEIVPVSLSSLSDRMERTLSDGDWLEAETLLEELQGDPTGAITFLSKWVQHFLDRGSSPKGFLILQKAVSLAKSHRLFAESRSLILRYLEANPEQLSARQLLAENDEESGQSEEAIRSYSQVILLLSKQRSFAEAQAYYEKIKSRLPGIAEVAEWRERFEAKPVEETMTGSSVEQSSEVSAIDEVIEKISSDLIETPAVPGPPQEPLIEVLEEGGSGSSSPEPPPVALSEVVEVIEPEPPPIENEIKEAPAEVSPEEGSPEPQEVPDETKGDGIEVLSETAFEGHLTEIDVYLKYGLIGKAIEQLLLLSRLAPSREEPHLHLKELYLREGMNEKAAEECFLLASLYEKAGAEEKRKAVLLERDALYPGEIGVETGGEEVVLSVETDSLESLAVVEGASPSTLTSDPVEEDREEKAEVTQMLERVDTNLGEVEIKLAQAEKCILSGDQEGATSLLWGILETDPNCDTARRMLLNLQAEVRPNLESSRSDEAEDPSDVKGEIRVSEDSLENFDQSLRTLVSDDESGKEESANRNQEEEDEEYIDLRSIFGEERKVDEGDSSGLEIQGLDDALEDLKQGGRHNQQEYETHYNLGIAYKEMGLIPEAIKEFELAFQGDGRFQDASSMLAGCYIEMGVFDTAIEILQNALADPRCRKENRLALTYELALLFDTPETRDRAKALYDEIYLLDPQFRDIGAKKAALAQEEVTRIPSVEKTSRPERGPAQKKSRISYL